MQPIKTEYIVLCGQIVGSGPFTTEYRFDGSRFRTRQDAIEHGFRIRGSDDFNIGVLRGGDLISLDWMEHVVDSDPAILKRIAEAAYI